MQRNMNVLYLLWGEDVSHDNGIFLSQVYTQLYAIHNCFPQINILCVAGIPILKKRILLNWRNYSKKLKKLKMFFCQKNITLVIRNLPILSRFNSSKQYFHYYSLFQKSFIKHLIKKNNIDIVHCRSYHSTYLALKTREKYSLDVKVVFDARGILPEEGVVKQNYTTDSADYSFWKDIEKYLLNYSDKIIVVSEPFKDHFKEISKTASIVTIPTSTDLNYFYRVSKRQDKESLLNISSQKKVLVYLGSLGRERWHTLDNLVEVYKCFREAFHNTCLLIISKANVKNNALKLLESENIPQEELFITSTDSMSDTNMFLNLCDYAVLPYRPVNSKVEEVLGRIIIASKTGEYLATGLPVVVNNKIGGASVLIETRNVGVVYSEKNYQKLIADLKEIDKKYSKIKEKCVTTAYDFFSVEKHAQEYVKVYKNVMRK